MKDEQMLGNHPHLTILMVSRCLWTNEHVVILAIKLKMGERECERVVIIVHSYSQLNGTNITY
jgi:hypothetical protein